MMRSKVAALPVAHALLLREAHKFGLFAFGLRTRLLFGGLNFGVSLVRLGRLCGIILRLLGGLVGLILLS
jgi:hypothetical protein